MMVIEVSEMLRQSGGYATLNWVRREENQEADDLTNEEFTKFDMANRVELKPVDIKWIVMDQLVEDSAVLYNKIVKLKEEDKKNRVAPTGRKTLQGKKKEKFFGRWST
eukprot:Skav202445  [mRNA]  locus=C8853232:125:448:- [translate_table: standard]